MSAPSVAPPSPSAQAYGVDEPDPNLLCSICLMVFKQPMRTACGHVFCGPCIDTWLRESPQCPECRSPVAPNGATSPSPDRLAGALVENLPTRCTFADAGCAWVGRRGDVVRHLAVGCAHTIVGCPNPGCAAEVPRGELAAHLRSCDPDVECPWGCGQRPGTAGLEAHLADCPLEPRKLLAAIEMLRAENERLTTENLRLRPAGPEGTLVTPQKRRVGPGPCKG